MVSFWVGERRRVAHVPHPGGPVLLLLPLDTSVIFPGAECASRSAGRALPVSRVPTLYVAFPTPSVRPRLYLARRTHCVQLKLLPRRIYGKVEVSLRLCLSFALRSFLSWLLHSFVLAGEGSSPGRVRPAHSSHGVPSLHIPREYLTFPPRRPGLRNTTAPQLCTWYSVPLDLHQNLNKLAGSSHPDEAGYGVHDEDLH